MKTMELSFNFLHEENKYGGQIITIGRMRREAEIRPVNFLSIPSGFGLHAAKIPRSTIPKMAIRISDSSKTISYWKTKSYEVFVQEFLGMI